MTHAADVDTELLTWPMAPDGYIPNSVIRNWKTKGKKQSGPDCWEDLLFNAPQCLGEDEMDDDTAGDLWFVEVDNGDSEEERTFQVRKKSRERDAETSRDEEESRQDANTKARNKIKVKERIHAFKPRMDQRKEEEEEEVAFQQLPDVQVDRSLSENLNISVETRPEPLKREVSSSLKSSNRLITSRPEGSEITARSPQRKRDSPSLQSLITPKPAIQESTTTPREWTKSLEVSSDAPSSKQDALSARPPSPEHTQPTPDRFPVPHPSLQLSAAKYDTNKDTSQMALSLKALALYKRFKVHSQGFSPQIRRSESGSRLYWPSAHISVRLHPGGVPPLILTLSSTSSPHHGNIHPKIPDPLHPDAQLDLSQFLRPIRGGSSRPVPEWRKTLHQLVSLQGFRSPWAAGRLAAGHQQEPAHPSGPSVTVPVPQQNGAEPHQRVVQQIRLRDSTEPTRPGFNQVFPLAPQQTFVTSRQCGTTRYGKLQFDWMRGFYE